VYNKLGTVIAIALAIFPFAAVLAKLAGTEGTTTVTVVAVIFVLFFATLFVATRITLDPDTDTVRAPRAPAPPIAWSWDGVNRQPDSDNGEEQVEAHH
jgi:hypothetical protein